MDFKFILSTTVMFFLLMDPFGNLPVFVTIMGKFPQNRYRPVIWRESLLALAMMALWLVMGNWLLLVLHLSVGELHLAGGLILMLIGIRMIFSKFSNKDTFESDSEPYFFPLAVPLICGPGLMAMLIAIRGSSPQATWSNLSVALLLAWLGGTLVLACGQRIVRILGNRALDAFEALMGLLLTAIAVGMLVRGLYELYGIGPS